MEAASGGYIEVGRVLLDKGDDVNVVPVHSSRDTAFTIAADKGHLKFVELLLSCVAAVEVKNKKGKSQLWLAANGGHLAVVEVLCNAGEDIDPQDKIAHLGRQVDGEPRYPVPVGTGNDPLHHHHQGVAGKVSRLRRTWTRTKKLSTFHCHRLAEAATQPPPQQTIAFIRENLHQQLQLSSSSSRTKRKVETPASTPTAKARARAWTSSPPAAKSSNSERTTKSANNNSSKLTNNNNNRTSARPSRPSNSSSSSTRSVHFSFVHPAPTKTKLQNLLKKRPRRLRHQQEPSTSAPYIKKWNWNLGAVKWTWLTLAKLQAHIKQHRTGLGRQKQSCSHGTKIAKGRT
ncbi:uncharacterized protein LOC120428358 isoform X2 [Culex pipiens pallens]|uniref:uncharacterized protein LOC120428358 isoform X2 n=1 Tax=Culex pipiens pallens TaxID=42434 RepID=UPI001952ABA1|nr:uncharacterized protein LOC120428358 isoform X2 [Culex pipiens pallens]